MSRQRIPPEKTGSKIREGEGLASASLARSLTPEQLPDSVLRIVAASPTPSQSDAGRLTSSEPYTALAACLGFTIRRRRRVGNSGVGRTCLRGQSDSDCRERQPRRLVVEAALLQRICSFESNPFRCFCCALCCPPTLAFCQRRLAAASGEGSLRKRKIKVRRRARHSQNGFGRAGQRCLKPEHRVAKRLQQFAGPTTPARNQIGRFSSYDRGVINADVRVSASADPVRRRSESPAG